MATRFYARIAIPKWARIGLASFAGLLLLALALAAVFPVSLFKGVVERRLSAEFDAPVSIGSLSREEAISFIPEIVVRDLRIAQPAWAGKGDFLKVSRASARMSVSDILTGDMAPRSITIEGLEAVLVRDAKGNSNWAGRADRRKSESGRALRLDLLSIDRSRFLLRDSKRRLDIAGTITADAQRGLNVDATGTFNGSPARIKASGNPIGQRTVDGEWPFSASLSSDILDLAASGSTAGPLNFRDMKLEMRARATSLKELDYVIEAGLFGTQHIDLAGSIRHIGEDWFIDRLNGTIGRSRKV